MMAIAIAIPLVSFYQLSGAQMQESVREPRTLVILGASYAKGWGSPALPAYEQVINRGVGGDNTRGMLARFPADVVALKPAAVLIWGHVNNITQARPDEIEQAKTAAREHYAAMLVQARAAGIEAIVATEVPWTETEGILNNLYGWYASMVGKTSYATRVSAHVHDVNRELESLCARQQCRVLDFESLFANDSGTRKSEYAAKDRSHISQAGYDALTAFAAKELRAGR
jgi:lysophospholipase L1-like esterase